MRATAPELALTLFWTAVLFVGALTLGQALGMGDTGATCDTLGTFR